MIRGFYVGGRGAAEYQKAMDVTANNLSNTNTIGFKSSRLSFKDVLYTRVRMPEDYEQNQGKYNRNVSYPRALRGESSPKGYVGEVYDRNGDYEYMNIDNVDNNGIIAVGDEPGPGEYFLENKLRTGGGLKIIESAINMSQGSFESTGNLLNAVITGDGFFCVQGIDGESYYYTREGSFRISAEEDGNYLVAGAGEYVMNRDFDRILVPNFEDGADFPYIVLDGEEVYDDANAIPVGVFMCNNIYGLHLTGGNKFTVTDISGEMEAVGTETTGVQAGYIEMSNVSLAEEMSKVIQFQRAFQANLSIVRTADEIEAYTNQLRG